MLDMSEITISTSFHCDNKCVNYISMFFFLSISGKICVYFVNSIESSVNYIRKNVQTYIPTPMLTMTSLAEEGLIIINLSYY